MVQILEGKPSLGALVGAGLGQGLQKGVAAGTEYAMRMGAIREKESAKQKALYERQTAGQEELSDFAKKLRENNPDNPALNIAADIYQLKTVPFEQKHELIKALIGAEPYEVSRKYYLNRDSISSEFDKQIKSLKGLLDSTANFTSEQRAGFKQQILDLMAERDRRLVSMDAMYGSEYGFAPKVAAPRIKAPSAHEEKEIEEEPSEVKMPKVKFNPKNPEHIAKFKQLDKQFKGDRKRVNDILAREFSL